MHLSQLFIFFTKIDFFRRKGRKTSSELWWLYSVLDRSILSVLLNRERNCVQEKPSLYSFAQLKDFLLLKF